MDNDIANVLDFTAKWGCFPPNGADRWLPNESLTL
jgi:hypothetical protein